MATGGNTHTQLGHGDCVWGTRRGTMSPPGPETTMRLSGAGAGVTVVDKEISFRGGSNYRNIGQPADGEEVEESPSQDYEDMAEEELVTQPAVHGTTAGTRRAAYFTASRPSQMCPPDDGLRERFWDEDVVTATTTGPSLSQSWRAGDAEGDVYAPGDPNRKRFAPGRTVTQAVKIIPRLRVIRTTELFRHYQRSAALTAVSVILATPSVQDIVLGVFWLINTGQGVLHN